MIDDDEDDNKDERHMNLYPLKYFPCIHPAKITTPQLTSPPASINNRFSKTRFLFWFLLLFLFDYRSLAEHRKKRGKKRKVGDKDDPSFPPKFDVAKALFFLNHDWGTMTGEIFGAEMEFFFFFFGGMRFLV